LIEGRRICRKTEVIASGRPLRPSTTANQDVIDAARLEFVDDREPELRTFGLFDPKPEHALLTVRLSASATYTAMFLTRPSSRILTAGRQSSGTTGQSPSDRVTLQRLIVGFAQWPVEHLLGELPWASQAAVANAAAPALVGLYGISPLRGTNGGMEFP
jgi:hypothetical protein